MPRDSLFSLSLRPIDVGMQDVTAEEMVEAMSQGELDPSKLPVAFAKLVGRILGRATPEAVDPEQTD